MLYFTFHCKLSWISEDLKAHWYLWKHLNLFSIIQMIFIWCSPQNLDVEIRDFFQLRKGKADRIFTFNDTNIDSLPFTLHYRICLWTGLVYISRIFIVGCSGASSRCHLHYTHNVVFNFHTRSSHTVCCAERTIKVLLSLLLLIIMIIN